MNEQGYKFGVGVLVVASMVIAIILILFFGAAPNIFANRYDVTIRFDEAPFVTTDTPVRKNGIPIGRVKNIELLNEGGVDLTLELDGKYTIRTGEQARVSKDSFITNSAVVEFVKADLKSLLSRFDGAAGSPADGIYDSNEQALAESPIKAGEWYRGGIVAPDPLASLLNMQEAAATTLTAVKQAGESIKLAGDQFAGLAGDVRKIIGSGDGELGKVAQKAVETIDNLNTTLSTINTAVTTFNGVMKDPRIDTVLTSVSQGLPKVIKEAESVMTEAKLTLESFKGAGSAAERTMNNVASFTEPFADQGDEALNAAKRSIENINGLVVDLRQLSSKANVLMARINNGQGTIARLIDDDDLYYSAVNTLQNIEIVTRRLQPVIEDARIFSDKISREPSSLINIRGAITGQRGGLK
jgi:phospholipid/cholesterol/gamma-HCH transport system substrate-binding protein